MAVREPEKWARFQRMLARGQRRRFARYEYARRLVPPQAVGIVLYDAQARHWFAVTPALRQDPGLWRVAYFDDRGPWGHDVADARGRVYTSKYDVLLDVLTNFRRARIVLYILPSGQRVEVGRGLPAGVSMPN
jgi:hypothetical protein